jgi:hypothetical protein
MRVGRGLVDEDCAAPSAAPVVVLGLRADGSGTSVVTLQSSAAPSA